MTLWDRVERWRGFAELDTLKPEADKWPGPDSYIEGRKDGRKLCASELEADLRELKELAAKWPHDRECRIGTPNESGLSGRCPRCVLEARIGGAK